MDKLRWWEDPEQLRLLHKRFEAVRADRRQFLAIVGAAGGAAAVSLALAACGGSEGEGGGGTTGESEGTQGTGTESTSQPGSAEGELAEEQVFRVNFETDPTSHDFNWDLYCGGEESLFAQLGQFDEDLQVQPDIAERWEANEDASVWTFYLRKDSKWSNGDPVTAHDYEWSWKRQLDPATAAPYAGFLYDLKNAEPFNLGQGNFTRDDIGVKAVDDYTLVCTLEGPRGYFPVLASYIAAAPSHRPSVEKYGDKWTEAGNCVSNGPFKLVEWRHDEIVICEKNEGYWNAANITLQRIERPIIASDASQLAYENNEIDWHYRGQLGQLERVQNDPTLSKEMVKYNLYGTWYLAPHFGMPPFDVREVRLAMSHAIDRDVIVNNVLKGLGTPAYTMTPPGMPGYNPNKYEEYTAFDPEKAMALLKGTPYEGGKNWPPITLTQREEGDAPKAAAEAIIQMLKEHLGMDIKHEIGEQREVYDRAYKHELQLWWVRWYIDYPDPNNTQYLVWYSKFPTGSRHTWQNEEYDRLVSEAAGEKDEEKRLEMYRQADELMLKDGAAIFVYNPYNYGLLKPWVSNFPRNSQGELVPTWNVFVRMYDRIKILKH